MFPNNFGKMFVDALLHVLVTIGRVFILPIKVWVKSTTNLVAQKGTDTFDINAIQTRWPYFTWCKRWLIDFGFDACIFLSYIVGVLVAVVSFFYNLFSYLEYAGFEGVLAEFISMIFVVYLLPLIWACVRDSIAFLLLPINKFIDWLKKPAQYCEIKKTE